MPALSAGFTKQVRNKCVGRVGSIFWKAAGTNRGRNTYFLDFKYQFGTNSARFCTAFGAVKQTRTILPVRPRHSLGIRTCLRVKVSRSQIFWPGTIGNDGREMEVRPSRSGTAWLVRWQGQDPIFQKIQRASSCISCIRRARAGSRTAKTDSSLGVTSVRESILNVNSSIDDEPGTPRVSA